MRGVGTWLSDEITASYLRVAVNGEGSIPSTRACTSYSSSGSSGTNPITTAFSNL